MANAYIPIGRGGAGALDLGTAALAAVSAGFVLFAMPDDLFTSLVVGARLPNFLAAAEPPLGQTDRLAAVAATCVCTFLAVFLLMRALDRVPAKRAPVAFSESEIEPETPRARRADLHPDAPTRRPLLAGRDLGEPEEAPLELNSPIVKEPKALEPRPLPDFLVPEPPAVDEVEPESQPEPPAPVAAEEEKDESVSHLMQRLERGLGKRQKTQAISRPEPEPQGQPDDQVGHRLRSALSELQQMASRSN